MKWTKYLQLGAYFQQYAMLVGIESKNFQKELGMKDLDIYSWIALVLLILGGLDSFLYGIFGFHLFAAILGNFVGRLFYIVIGGAGGWFCYQIYLTKFKRSAV